jgi:predicted DsbA family dithiol-disulfide isomerase
MTASVFGAHAERLVIDVWSDVMCPFCYLGDAHLNQAIERFPHGSSVDVVYHSFQLMPELEVGKRVDLLDLLVNKRGFPRAQAEAGNARITAQGAKLGLDFRFDRAVTTNTLDAHRLTHFAKAAGRQREMVERLFKAYFTDGRDVGSHEELADLAAEAGLDRAGAAAALATGAFEADVAADINQARQYGITGVPFFVLDQKYAVSGAQPVEAFLQALQTAWDARTTPATAIR